MFKYFNTKIEKEIELTPDDIYFLYVLLNFDGEVKNYDLASYEQFFKTITNFEFYKKYLSDLKTCPSDKQMNQTADKLTELGLVARDEDDHNHYRCTPETHFLLYWFTLKDECPEIKFLEVINKFLNSDSIGQTLPDDHWDLLLRDGYIPDSYCELNNKTSPEQEQSESWEIVNKYLMEMLPGKSLAYISKGESADSKTVVVGVKGEST